MHFIYHVHLLSSTHSLINIQNTQRHNNLYLCLLHFSSKLWVLLQKNKKQKKASQLEQEPKMSKQETKQTQMVFSSFL